MGHERLDPAFLPLLATAGTSLTAGQIRERCTDPWAPPLTDQWLREAFDRGLVSVARQGALPAQWTISPRGRRRYRQQTSAAR